MVAIDPNILIGVLVIFSVLAYVFVLRRMKTNQPNPVNTTVSAEPAIEKARAGDTKDKEIQPKKTSKKKTSPECDHHFGYLSTLSKKSNPPRECLLCSKMTECMTRKKPRKTRNKYVETIPAIGEETKVSAR